MKKIIVIWLYWFLFLVAGLGLIWLVENSEQLPGIKREPTLVPNQDMLKIQGEQRIPSDPLVMPEDPVWKPLLEKQSSENLQVIPKVRQVNQEDQPNNHAPER